MPIKHVSKAFAKLQQKVRSLQNRLLQNEQETGELEKHITLPTDEAVDRVVVELSIWSAFKVVLLIFGAMLVLSFLGRITNILLLLFLAAFFAITLNPGVDKLQRWKIPRSAAVIFLMILVLSIILGILGGLIPIIGGEVAKMWAGMIDFAEELRGEDFTSLPLWAQSLLEDIIPAIEGYLTQVSPEELQSTITNFVKDNIGNYLDSVTTVAGKGLSILLAIFGGIFQFALVLILTFFLVVEKGNISQFFVHLFPSKYENYIVQKSQAVHVKISEWVHGQITLFFIIAIIAYVGLQIIGVKYAVTLALIAGLAEFFPYIGPIIAFASAAPVAFNDSFSVGIATMCLYAGIQFLEGNFILPLVMKKAVGISPIVTIISMLIGWEFLGIVGMIIAVPTASVCSIFVTDYSGRERASEPVAIRKKSIGKPPPTRRSSKKKE